jgi:GH15 family glucan-1,4-alpha-glucosidase
MGYQSIENYGIVGDLHTVALVGMNGSIDFMSFPHFDSPTIFAGILDDNNGGKFSIAPFHEKGKHRQMYLPDTNVLLTRFLYPEGVGELSDFMPVQEHEHVHQLVRRIKTIRGRVRYRMVFDPRFDYGKATHRVAQENGCIHYISEGSDRTALRLRTSIPVKLTNGVAVADFTLSTGESVSFVLEEARTDSSSPSEHPKFVSRSFKDTVNYWRSWINKSTYRGRWREMVHR